MKVTLISLYNFQLFVALLRVIKYRLISRPIIFSKSSRIREDGKEAVPTYNDAMCRSVVALRDGSEPLLSGRVPDLKLQHAQPSLITHSTKHYRSKTTMLL